VFTVTEIAAPVYPIKNGGDALPGNDNIGKESCRFADIKEQAFFCFRDLDRRRIIVYRRFAIKWTAVPRQLLFDDLKL